MNTEIPFFALASADFHSPALWAVLLAWIMSVVFHEFAHGLVAHFGGDHTIRERGGLTLNPLQYIDPMFSIIIPLFLLATGGIPLPGGVTYIRNDLLRNRYWATAVSLAGPASNFLLFLLLALPFHPRVRWIDPPYNVADWSTLQLVMGTLVVLQFMVVIINLIPIPPLDGFGAIRPWFDAETRAKFSSPQVSWAGIAVLYFLVLRTAAVSQGIYNLSADLLIRLGFDPLTVDSFREAFNKVVYGG